MTRLPWIISLNSRAFLQLRWVSGGGGFHRGLGRSPADAPNIVPTSATFNGPHERDRAGNESACQNEGAKYTAKELIQGETRSKFQDDLPNRFEKQSKPETPRAAGADS